MEWTVIIQMGKTPRDGTENGNRTRMRAKERGSSEERWKERFRWTQTQEKDPVRRW